MKIVYGVTKPDAGTIHWEGQIRAHRQSGGGAAPRHRHGVPAFLAVRDADGRREHLARARRAHRDPRATGAGASREVSENYGLPIDPQPARAQHVGRRAAARRDRALPVAGAEAADHGRADVGADAAGGAEAVRDAAPAGGRGLQHSVHQPQARRDPGAVRHGDGLARRQGERHGDPAEGNERQPRAHDDRQRACRMPARRRATPGEVRLARRSTCRSRRSIRSARRCRTSASSVRGGEIVGIAGVSGNGQKELLAALSGETLADTRRRVDPHRRQAGRQPRSGATAPARTDASCPRSGSDAARCRR